MPKFLVKITESIVRQTTIEVDAQFADEARFIANTHCNDESFNENNFNILIRETNIVDVVMK